MSVETAIRAKLSEAFQPSLLIVENDSARHAGHAHLTHHLARGPGAVTGETHFNVTIEAEAFTGLSRVASQRLVHAALKDELAGPVHALSVRASAPASR